MPVTELAVVMMGVSGAGKTTVGRRLAEALGAEFIDGDDLHTDGARAKMRSGFALTDEDRWPWLDRVGGVLAAGLATRRGAVVACSALRRAYRDRLRLAVGPALHFAYLAGNDARPRWRTPGALHAGLARRQPVRRVGAAARRGRRDRSLGRDALGGPNPSTGDAPFRNSCEGD